MNFDPPESVKPLLAKIASFINDHVVPAEHDVLDHGFTASAAKLDELRARVKREGMWGPQIPKDHGGLGLGLVEHGLVSEQLGKSPLGHYVFGAQAPDAGNLEILHKYGTPEQKSKWLEPLAKGEIRSCFSMTEPENPGSNPTMLSCSARKDGNDYIVDGHKWFTSSADGAAFAIVMAVTDPNAAPHSRASMIIVPTDSPGFERVRNIKIMGDAGDGWASHAELRYHDVRVPQTNRLGPEGAGFLIAQERLGPGRIHHCMRWIGTCERVFDTMCKHITHRKIGDDKTLAMTQTAQTWVAESRAEIDASRLMVLHAAWTLEQKGFHAARDQVSLIKFYVANVMLRLVDRAIQLHGALGITSDTVLSYYYVHERGSRIYDGPDEVHKMVVAKRILARYE
ncbi:MAG TPA: acyl-CoA dehydrogenase family protein [Kofleriaceae bacterium]|jgi:alkylation response protein AidB-like acyl-CoA dehydrogenase|nr:acyl-CoA dehydrogenase family protein [Kofleriaceae bacterium]